MTKSEISQKIFQLERDIADAEKRKAEAEKNICQLNALNASCRDYQAEFESARAVRKIKKEGVNQIVGQARFVGAYDGVLGDFLDGTEYISAYGSMDTAKFEISQEIERQRQIINDCNSQIAGFNSGISYWRQELVSADQEDKDAVHRVSDRR